MSGQWTLPIELREFRADDYGSLAHVFGSIFPDYDRTPEEWKFEDESLDKSKYHFKRYSCISKEVQEPVGFAQCQHVPWMYHPRKLWFDIWVNPQHQRKGIGTTAGQCIWINSWDHTLDLASDLALECNKRKCSVLMTVQLEDLWLRSIIQAPIELVDNLPAHLVAALKQTDIYIYTLGPRKPIPWDTVPA